MRGYVTVGSASVNEARILLQRQLPDLIIVCCVRVGQEETIVELRNMTALDNIPVVMVVSEPPDSEWMKAWHVSSALPYPMDLRNLVQSLSPWLEGSSEKKSGVYASSQGYQLRGLTA
jgi:DNA-binding response OmpR family regulator